MAKAAKKSPDAAPLLTLSQLDGRTIAARQAKSLISELESDLGGADRISAAEREIVRRAAVATAVLESMEAAWLAGKSLDIAAYCTLANTQRRLLATVGLERRDKDVTPDLSKYIEARAT